MANSGNRLWDKGDSLNKEIHAFTVGNDPIIDLSIITWDCLASAAHARMLNTKKLLKDEELKSLLKCLEEAYNLAKENKFEIPFELEDAHTALEVFLTKSCGEAGKRIHAARSRNDQVLVATRLFIRHELLKHVENLEKLAELALKRAEPLINLQMPGYTHFQQAMPASVGMWLASISEQALSIIKDALSLYDLINCNPLGAASGFYTTIEIDRELTTKLLKFKKTQRNPIEIQNSRGRYETKIVRLFSDTSSLIEKYSSDIILYSMSELGFFKIPDGFTTGSSIMPQKRNPDVLELLRGTSSKVRACQFELESIISKLPSHYHRDFQLTKDPLIRATEILKSSLPIFTKVIEGIEFNEETINKAKTPELYATYHAYKMVKDGAPFREAYLNTAKDLKDGKINISELENDFSIISKLLEKEIALAKEELKVFSEARENEMNIINSLSTELFKIN